MKTIAPFVAALLLAGCCCRATKYAVATEVIDEAQPPVKLQAPVPPPHERTRIVMRHVHLRQADTFFVDVRRLLGIMTATHPDGIPFFDDASSYEVHVQAAEVAMNAASLSGLLNNYVFAYKGSPIDHLLVQMNDKHHLVQKGILHKTILGKRLDLPFTIEAQVEPTSDGKLRLRPVEVKICDVNGKPLLALLHIRLEKVLDLSGAKGVTVQGNDLVLDPQTALPAPKMLGRVTAVRIEGDELVQEVGPAPDTPHVEEPPPPPDRDVPNYIHLYGGTVRFGRLYMVGTNLQLADAHPADPFEFYTTYFDNQLAAGWSRSHLDGSLTTYCPDFSQVGKTLSPREVIRPAR